MLKASSNHSTIVHIHSSTFENKAHKITNKKQIFREQALCHVVPRDGQLSAGSDFQAGGRGDISRKRFTSFSSTLLPNVPFALFALFARSQIWCLPFSIRVTCYWVTHFKCFALVLGCIFGHFWITMDGDG